MVKLRERVLVATALHIARENQLEVLRGIMVNQVQARVSREPMVNGGLKRMKRTSWGARS